MSSHHDAWAEAEEVDASASALVEAKLTSDAMSSPSSHRSARRYAHSMSISTCSQRSLVYGPPYQPPVEERSPAEPSARRWKKRSDDCMDEPPIVK